MADLSNRLVLYGESLLSGAMGFRILQHKKFLKTVLLVVFLVVSNFLTLKSNSNSILHLPPTNDSLIKVTWNKFVKAILGKDFTTFKKMSTHCIHCPWCVRNTKKEDSLFKSYKFPDEKTRYEHLYSDLCFIPIDRFEIEDYPIIFTKKVRTRMKNKSNFVFTNIIDFPKLYSKPCIIEKPNATLLYPIEVLLIDVEASSGNEGKRIAFAFIQVDGQYKFCGFSTEP